MSELVVTHNAGLTSCLSVRLHEVCRFREQHGHFPESINSTAQFEQYKAAQKDNLSAKLLSPTSPHAEDSMANRFIHDWQFSWYGELPMLDLQRLARSYVWPGPEVLARARRIHERMAGRTGVLYRGNDKEKEIERTPYEAMFEMAEKSGSTRFWVQTDEEQFLREFSQRFQDTDHLEFMPRIPKNPNAYVSLPRGQMPNFAMNFLSAIFAIGSTGEQFITTTGNTGLWATIYRGHTKGLWQYFSRHGTFRST